MGKCPETPGAAALQGTEAVTRKTLQQDGKREPTPESYLPCAHHGMCTPAGTHMHSTYTHALHTHDDADNDDDDNDDDKYF